MFWVDRARLAYPARMTTALTTVFMALVVVGLNFALGEDMENMPGGWAIGLTAMAAYVGGLVIAVITERHVRGQTFRVGIWVRDLITRLLILSLYGGTVVGTIYLLPDTVNLRAVSILVVAMLVLTFTALGGVPMLFRWTGLVRPASPRLTAIVAEAVARTGIKPKGAHEVKSTQANAMAMVVQQRLVVTNRAMEHLTDAELTSICAHELAHLSEPKSVTILRVFCALQLFLVCMAYRPVLGDFGHTGVIVMLVAFLIVLKATRRVARRMEVRADATGRAHQGEEGTYAQALERIYELNLMPAVMSGKRRVHPHLYDRLVAAGVTPSYPRPKPPSRLVIWLSLVVAVTVAAILYGTAFILLNMMTVSG